MAWGPWLPLVSRVVLSGNFQNPELVSPAQIKIKRMTCFAEPFVDWNVQLTGRACIHNMDTTGYPVTFRAYQDITFQHCRFNSSITLQLLRVQGEGQTPRYNTIKQLQGAFQGHQVLIEDSVFATGVRMTASASEVVWQVKVAWSEMHKNQMRFHVGVRSTQYSAYLSLIMEECEMDNSSFDLQGAGLYALALVTVYHSSFYESEITQLKGMGSYDIQNSSFVQVNSPALDLRSTGNVVMSQCNVKIGQSEERVNALSADFPVINFDYDPNMPSPLKHLLCPDQCNIVKIDSSTFNVPQSDHGFTAMIESNKATVLEDCSLNVKGHSFQKFILMTGDHSLNFGTLSINAPFTIHRIHAIVSTGTGTSKPTITGNLICPPSYLVSIGQVSVSCQQICVHPELYSAERGNMTIINGNKDEVNEFIPLCWPCPSGASCAGELVALPNYWGFSDDSGWLTMIRCPPGYCCQGNETCHAVDSCNTGRMGTLCGTCEPNHTEALFLSRCIAVEKCRDYLVVILYIAGAIFIAFFLGFKDEFLDNVPQLLGKAFNWF